MNDEPVQTFEVRSSSHPVSFYLSLVLYCLVLFCFVSPLKKEFDFVRNLKFFMLRERTIGSFSPCQFSFNSCINRGLHVQVRMEIEFKQLKEAASIFVPRGHFVYSSDGDVPSFRVSFSPIFSTTRYQKEAAFLEPVIKTCQKGKFC